MLYQRVHRPFWRHHPVVTVTVLAMTTWWMWHGWYEPLAITAAVGLLLAMNRRRRALAIRDAGLRARAEYEHRLAQFGDHRGTFGRYPPVQPGWYRDPYELQSGRLRYFDGAVWTPYAVQRQPTLGL